MRYLSGREDEEGSDAAGSDDHVGDDGVEC